MAYIAMPTIRRTSLNVWQMDFGCVFCKIMTQALRLINITDTVYLIFRNMNSELFVRKYSVRLPMQQNNSEHVRGDKLNTERLRYR